MIESKEAIGRSILENIRSIYDPEIPVNIFDLGLIYEVNIDDDHFVEVQMTLTSPNCPEAQSIPAEVESKVLQVEGVEGVRVNLVWDPPWSPARMSDEAKLELDMF